MFRRIVCFLRDERATTSIEYALIGGLISVAIVLGALALGSKLNVTYTAMANSIPG